ncbi:MAG: hypothetical protein EB078_06885, partial [Proteobacteria bacterium]|nr:hypothetical protein [Pseudomonadota bacterium]
LYEIHLRNYFLMLYEAESPFAFPSIGSCLAIQASSYAQVRGFPKRQAGEDFHLLNKLRKLGAIHYRKGEPISLRGRFSHRVPFGTGQSTTDIFRLLTQGDEYSLYNPASFVFLKQLMKASEQTLNVPSEQFAKAFQSWREYLILQSPSGFSAGEKLLLPDLLQAAYQQRTNYRQRSTQRICKSEEIL